MKYEDFIDLSYKPGKNDLICLFRITSSKNFSIKDAAIRVAAESSNGTWSDLSVPKHVESLSARVFEISKDNVKIAYPEGLFEDFNMPQVMSSIAGNIFGMKAVDGLRLEDVSWPKKLVESFRGPQFGVDGIRKFMNIKERPLTATVPKPKVGYYPKEHAKVGFEAWCGGVDLLKDDENLTDQSFNRFKERLKLCMKMRDKAEKITGERKSYLINVTAETKEMLKRARLAKEYGNEFVMIDTLTAGWAATQTLREECRDLKLAIHCHRAFHSAFDRNPFHGLSMKVVAEIARIEGVDLLHIGGMGKLVGEADEVETNYVKSSTMSNQEGESVLAQDWFKVKRLLSVCSGGLHPGILKPLFDLLGTNIAIQVGGGVHSHPEGTKCGATALREAIDAYMEDTPIAEYAKTHKCLKEALNKWGTKVYE